jgi:hypothetical protein
MRPDAEEKPTLQPQERRPGLGLQATGHQQGQSFRQAEKTATIRPGSEFIWEIPAYVRHRIRGQKRSDAPQSLNTDPSDQDYRVGPGRPPKQYQFKPGQSGNPKGARRKPRSIAPDLKALFERALSTKVTLRQGEQQKIITKAAAGKHGNDFRAVVNSAEYHA